MMERKQAMKYDLTQIHAAFRAIGDGLALSRPRMAACPARRAAAASPTTARRAARATRRASPRDERPVKEHYGAPDHIHVGHPYARSWSTAASA